MPRGKKKAGKALEADFVKRKKRVGKKLTSNTATDVSFRSRTINISASNDLARNTGMDTTERGLSLPDLLVRCGHYSPQVRRSAIDGLRSFFALHPDNLTAPATLLNLLEALCARFSDGAAAVRRALTRLLETLLDIVPASHLSPFFPMLLLHTRRAMTELDTGVQRGSLTLVDLWIERCPQLVRQHGAHLLDNFLRLVASECRAGAKSAAAATWQTSKSLRENPNDQMATLDGRMAVFRRLLAYIELMAAEGNSGSNNSNDNNTEKKKKSGGRSGSSDGDVVAGAAYIEWSQQASSVQWRRRGRILGPEPLFTDDALGTTTSATKIARSVGGGGGSGMDDITMGSNEASSRGSSSSSSSSSTRRIGDVQHLEHFFLDDLHPLLMATLLELEPAHVVTSTGVNMDALPHIYTIVALCRTFYSLLRPRDQPWRMAQARAYHATIGVHFPLGGGSDGIAYCHPVPALVEANLAVAETMELFLSHSDSNCSTTVSSGVVWTGSTGGTTEYEAEVERWASGVVRFVCGLLQNASTTTLKNGSKSGGGPAAVAAGYTVSGTRLDRALTLASRLSAVRPDAGEQLLTAAHHLYTQCHNRSADKRRLVQFLGASCLGESLGIRVVLADSPVLLQWLSALPRLLYGLSNTAPETTMMLIKVLHAVATRGLKGGNDADVPLLDTLQPYLALLLFARQKGAPVYGPFVQLPVAAQRRLLHAIFYLTRVTPSLVRGLVWCAQVLSTETVSVLLDVVRLRAEAAARVDAMEEVGLCLSTIVSIAVGLTTELLDTARVSAESSDNGAISTLAAVAGGGGNGGAGGGGKFFLVPTLVQVGPGRRPRAAPVDTIASAQSHWERRRAVLLSVESTLVGFSGLSELAPGLIENLVGLLEGPKLPADAVLGLLRMAAVAYTRSSGSLDLPKAQMNVLALSAWRALLYYSCGGSGGGGGGDGNYHRGRSYSNGGNDDSVVMAGSEIAFVLDTCSMFCIVDPVMSAALVTAAETSSPSEVLETQHAYGIAYALSLLVDRPELRSSLCEGASDGLVTLVERMKVPLAASTRGREAHAALANNVALVVGVK